MKTILVIFVAMSIASGEIVSSQQSVSAENLVVCGTPTNPRLTLNSSTVSAVLPSTTYVVKATGGGSNIMMCIEPGAGYSILGSTGGCNDASPDSEFPVASILTNSTLPANGITILVTGECSGSESNSVSLHLPKQ